MARQTHTAANALKKIEKMTPQDCSSHWFSKIFAKVAPLEDWELRKQLHRRIERLSRQLLVYERASAELYAWNGNPAPLVTLFEAEFLIHGRSVAPLVRLLMDMGCPKEAYVYLCCAQEDTTYADRPELELLFELETTVLSEMAKQDEGESRSMLCPPLALIDDAEDRLDDDVDETPDTEPLND